MIKNEGKDSKIQIQRRIKAGNKETREGVEQKRKKELGLYRRNESTKKGKKDELKVRRFDGIGGVDDANVGNDNEDDSNEDNDDKKEEEEEKDDNNEAAIDDNVFI